MLLISTLAGLACGPSNAGDEVLVFAATSLTDALDEAVADFEAANDAKVLVSYGGSQTLAQQIAVGAPADIFISAAQFPVDFLEERQVPMLENTDLLSNRLVLVADGTDNGVDNLAELLTERIGRVAVAAPDLAPAGLYARESLISLGLWDELQDKIVFGADVRATMAYVEAGNADVAFVYETDAAISKGLVVVDVVPVDSYSPIAYPAVLLQGGGDPATAAKFHDYLSGDEATVRFEAHGFTVLGSGK